MALTYLPVFFLVLGTAVLGQENTKLFIVGDTSKNPIGSNVEMIDLLTGKKCFAAPLASMTGLNGSLQGVYLDGKVFVCDGVSPNCYVYEETVDGEAGTWGWSKIGDLKYARTQGAGVLVPAEVGGKGWWFSGGLPEKNTLNSSEILIHGEWQESEQIPLTAGLCYHCKVQINKTNSVVIGGFSQEGSTINVKNSASIYNWETEEWTNALDLPLNDMAGTACGKIKDPFNDQILIMIAGGFNPILDKNTDKVWFWDPATNVVQAGPKTPHANDGMKILEYTETVVFMLSGYHGDHDIFYYSVANGWQKFGETTIDNTFSAPMLVPNDFGSCN